MKKKNFWQRFMTIVAAHQQELEGLKKECVSHEETLFLTTYQKKALEATTNDEKSIRLHKD